MNNLGYMHKNAILQFMVGLDKFFIILKESISSSN